DPLGLDYSRAWWWVGVLGGLAFLRGVIQYAAGMVSLYIGQELLYIIRERILVQVQNLDLAYHTRHGVGELVTRTTRDADKVRDALVNFWRNAFDTALIGIVSIALLSWYSPLLGLVPLICIATGVGLLLPQMDRLVLLDSAVGTAYDAVNQDLAEGVHGVRVIKAFGLEEARISSFGGQVSAFADEARAALVFASQRVPLPQLVIALSQVWVLVYGAHLVGMGRLSIGELLSALLVANSMVLRTEGVGQIMRVVADARSSAARIWALLGAEQNIVAGSSSVPSGPLGLTMERVRVGSPDGGRDVLRDLSFSIAPGEIVALVGATGSGKSLLMSLLPRLTEADDGAVLIGPQGRAQDVRNYHTDELRRRVHVLPQESFLFSDTLEANLRIANPAATDEELVEAMRLAAASEVLAGLPDGLKSRIGDRGATLSGGQRQRVCLARALLSRSSILALDDATSALDAATERTVLQNIRELRQTSDSSALTMLIISSKLSTILMTDRVLLLADGKISAQGTHEELAACNSSYRELMGIG
ncbi:MAG: ABC transporter ATP-binding protein, partial [Candidatus Methylacidiphilales bacterium]